MKLKELLEELEGSSPAELEYEVRVEDNTGRSGVRWEHLDDVVVIEAG